jgi:beta-phosphoglucomutase-like phosphatase (HAD superfamily)
MTHIQAVLVDIDGTTADCEKRNRGVLEDLALANGGKIEPSDWRVLAGTSDRFIHNWLAKKFSTFSIPQDDFVEDVKKGYLRRAFEVVARDGMVDNFNHIQSRNIPVAAVTNSPTNIALSNMTATGCTHYMQFVLTADDVEAAGHAIKPAPDPYLLAAARLGVPASACLVFEDSATGVKSGVAAGCTVVQIVDDPAMASPDAHFHVYNPAELRAICKKLIP